MEKKYDTTWKVAHSFHLIVIFMPVFGVIGFFRRKTLSGQNRWLAVALIYLLLDVIGIVAANNPKSAFYNFAIDVNIVFYLATIVYACVTQPAYLRAVIRREEGVSPAASEPTQNQVTFTVSHETQKEVPKPQPNNILNKIFELGENFKDQSVYPQLTEIKAIAFQISEYILQHPEAQNSARTFTNYYLPEYVKLLENYVELSRTSVKTEKVTESMEQFQNSLPKTIEAFKNLYNHLYSEKADDISNSLNVFEEMMSEDGLTKDSDDEDSIHLKI